MIASPMNWTTVPPAARMTGTTPPKYVLRSATTAAGSVRSLNVVNPRRSANSDGDLARRAPEVGPVGIGQQRRRHLGREIAPEQAELADLAPLGGQGLGRLDEDVRPGPRSGRTAR